MEPALLKPVEQPYNVTIQAARKGNAHEEKPASKPRGRKASKEKPTGEPPIDEPVGDPPPPPEDVPGVVKMILATVPFAGTETWELAAVGP